MSVLNAKGLRKHYGTAEVVAGIDLEVNAGECFGLLGPNGAGKTTTLRLLLGLVDPDAGEMNILDYPIPAMAREARMKIGVVPQMDSLDPDFTVHENLMVYGRYFGIPDAEIAARIPELLELAGLSHRADARINALSGGMKRRLTLARALINDPDVIFLDEPTTGLDPQARHMMWQGLRRLLNKGKTIILTTHFMDEAERICDRLSVMDNGKIIATGSPRELIEQYIEPGVVELYGEQAAAWGQQYGATLCERAELAGETLFCYTRDGQALMENLRAQTSMRYMHRPANLEDVFLKLTGRDLRD
ncbi:ATP-binding cassette domain-containing protein [Sulfurirhabdus autotrophica]|uniref:Lipooligosaccharide transport system ATP-binding protein n=1 Tax=Sulfurirhabdus autotrophica TaxID=1706046 RepID=A0A4R3YBN9_9PROT|nr:ATP-binding cassette domain-containing protein [Sulfurirhabdus autotrophica]TCV88164.1 lipooligosaccharide transport system ATP-binding protein [Sulfurirhabdus autotrophica]